MTNYSLCITYRNGMHLMQERTVKKKERKKRRRTCFSNMQIFWLLLKKAWRDKGNQWPMVARIKPPLRWRNHNEVEAHLSTTRFHIQVAALLSYRPGSFLLWSCHTLARPPRGYGEITSSSKQSIGSETQGDRRVIRRVGEETNTHR